MFICFLAELLEYLIPLPVAASIYGLLLMLAALVTGIIPLEKVEGVADFLLENMIIMFIPPTVGIMANVDEVKAMLVPLVVISAGTTLLIMAVTGWTAQGIIRRQNGNKKSAETEAASDSSSK